MKITVCETDLELGIIAAKAIAEKIKNAIEKNGEARIILSTGASQFETIEELVKLDIDWSKVTMFHLDEYLNMSETHPASFKKYLKERFLSKVPPLGKVVFVDGEGPVGETLANLSREIRERPIDVAVIGIGENAHIAFNDPPADFDTNEAFKVVVLDEACRHQQFGEGWFPTFDDVPKEAISMTPFQIMESLSIISPVPRAMKADAIAATLGAEDVTPTIPATLLKTHPDFHLILDKMSSAKSGEYI